MVVIVIGYMFDVSFVVDCYVYLRDLAAAAVRKSYHITHVRNLVGWLRLGWLKLSYITLTYIK